MHDVDEAASSEASIVPELETLRRRSRWLTATVIVLAVAVLGLVAWATLGETGGERDALTVEQERMLDTIDAYLAALTAGDTDAMAAVMAPEGFFYEDLDRRFYLEDGELAEFVDGLHSLGFVVSRESATVVDNVVLVNQTRNFGGSSPAVFVMSHDGAQVLVHVAL